MRIALRATAALVTVLAVIGITAPAQAASGKAPGITTVTDNYAENGTLELEIATPNGVVAGTDYDQVNVTNSGTVTLGAAATLTVPYLGKAGTFKKKPLKWMQLEIPVTEGEQYHVGKIEFEGVKVFKEPFLRSYFKLQPGKI